MAYGLDNGWSIRLEQELSASYFKHLMNFVKNEYATKTVFPSRRDLFRAFQVTPFGKVKVVILGQDPYHGAGQAQGLCFSVPSGMRTPPSLKNIFKEISQETALPAPLSGDLAHWAEQGVLLLNATLTVTEGAPGAHQGKGWEQFTDAVVKKISDEKEHVVFLLWGNYAKHKVELIDKSKHLILIAAHPSPLSAYKGFFGCGHFVKANEYLLQKDMRPINWF
jgi:uracil-DNA glycosylase